MTDEMDGRLHVRRGVIRLNPDRLGEVPHLD